MLVENLKRKRNCISFLIMTLHRVSVVKLEIKQIPKGRKQMDVRVAIKEK